MTKSEAIYRAALRKHRHKGNYIATHEALLAEAEYLQQTQPVRMSNEWPVWAYSVFFGLCFGFVTFQIIKGWLS